MIGDDLHEPALLGVVSRAYPQADITVGWSAQQSDCAAPSGFERNGVGRRCELGGRKSQIGQQAEDSGHDIGVTAEGEKRPRASLEIEGDFGDEDGPEQVRKCWKRVLCSGSSSYQAFLLEAEDERVRTVLRRSCEVEEIVRLTAVVIVLANGNLRYLEGSARSRSLS
ncbi:hypothetical protein [Nannocystis pusilla]|uniref:hypothetical protein n=1 Tax=Nannocystis pusilla TaxID=889268 RepID=UPI003B7C6594